jgi:hypothetical protein
MTDREIRATTLALKESHKGIVHDIQTYLGKISI